MYRFMPAHWADHLRQGRQSKTPCDSTSYPLSMRTIVSTILQACTLSSQVADRCTVGCFRKHRNADRVGSRSETRGSAAFIGAIVFCSVCNGSTKCRNCGGSGEVLCSVCSGTGWQLVFCSPCNGLGRLNDGSACQPCGMTGRAKVDCPKHQRCQQCNGSGNCSFC